MLSVKTKGYLKELLLTFGQGYIQLNSIKSVLANQDKFIIEHVYRRLTENGELEKVTKNSLKNFLDENSIYSTMEEIEMVFKLHSKFSDSGFNQSE
jgi:hypothetical protein